MKKISITCFVLLTGFILNAQVGTLYTFSQFPGTYVPVATGGTLFNTSAFDDQHIVDPLGTGIIPNNANPAAATGPGVDIGFNFMYNGYIFDRMGISNNGYVVFGASTDGSVAINDAISDWNRPISSTAVTPAKNQQRIAPFGTDLLSRVGSNIRVRTFGSAPTRSTVIQWSDYQIFIAAPTGSDNINFQLWLYETSNTIDAVYGTVYSPTLDSCAQVGLRGSSNLDYNNRSVSPPATWATSVPGLSQFYFARYNTVLYPASGQTYRWEPPQCSGTLASLTTTGTIASSCPGSTLNLGLQNSYTVSGISYTWSSSSSSSAGPYTVIPNSNAPGMYSLAVGVTSWFQVASTCIHSNITTTSTSYYVAVAQAPTLTASASVPTICSGANLTLTAVGNATAYAWTGGYTTGIGFPATVSTTYIVTGTNAIGCTSTAAVPVTVVPTPIQPILVSPTVICDGGTATLTSPPATNYTWTSATQTVFTSSLVTPTLPAGTTTYTVTKSNANCFSTQTISVLSNSLPSIFAIASPPQICGFGSTTLTVAGATSYTWTSPPPNAFTVTGASAIMSPQVPTTYTVDAFDGLCANSLTLFVATNPNPTVSISTTSTSICMGQSVTLTANGGISYTWVASSGATSTAQIFVDSPTTATSYQLIGDNQFSCTATANQVVFVNPIPTISIVPTKSAVCSGGATTLTASGAATYTWDASANGALTPTTVVAPTSLVTGLFIYTVQGTNSFSCSSSKTVAVGVFVPSLTTVGNTSACVGGLISLTVTGGNTNSYVWKAGTITQTSSTISNTIATPGEFTVTGTGTSAQMAVTCPATLVVPVGVHPNPSVTAVPQRTTICKFEHVEIHAAGALTYTWTNHTANGATLTASPQNLTNNYTVTGTDANSCVSSGTTQVKVSTCQGFSELNTSASLSLFPNPNNGEFNIQSNADIILTVTNELGQNIRTIKLDENNNHQVSVTDLAKGIYFISGEKDNVRFYQKVVVLK